jgi:hypothetical protein
MESFRFMLVLLAAMFLTTLSGCGNFVEEEKPAEEPAMVINAGELPPAVATAEPEVETPTVDTPVDSAGAAPQEEVIPPCMKLDEFGNLVEAVDEVEEAVEAPPAKVESPTVEPPGRKRVGERARYKLSESKKRSSSAFDSGKASAVVDKVEVKKDGSSVYKIVIKYDIDLTWWATFFADKPKDTVTLPVASEFFEPDFVSKLQTKKSITAEGMTFEWLGTCSVKFPGSDKVHNGYSVYLKGFPTSGKFKNVRVTGCLNPEEPVLGALTLDFSFDYEGKPYIAGFNMDR